MSERIPPSPSEYDHVQGFTDGESWIIAVIVGAGIVALMLLIGFRLFA